MARNRMVNDGVFRSPKMASVSIQARYLFVGLTTIADDYGNVPIHPALVRAGVVPLDDFTLLDLQDWITELTEKNFLMPYSVDGDDYASIVGWSEKDSIWYQKVDRPSKKRNPTPLSEDSTSSQRALNEDSTSVRRGLEDVTRTRTSTRTVTRNKKKNEEPRTRKIVVKRKKIPVSKESTATPVPEYSEDAGMQYLRNLQGESGAFLGIDNF